MKKPRAKRGFLLLKWYRRGGYFVNSELPGVFVSLSCMRF